MDASHPIFRGPFPVPLQYEDMPTPENYRHYPEGKDLGATMPAWRVARQSVGGYVGVVADGYGMTDSPDSEWISSGRNSKNPTAAALARQGNFFQWGFSPSPENLTESAQAVFLNTLHYMRQFRGQMPLGESRGRSRRWAEVMTRYFDEERMVDYASKQLPAEVVAAGKQGGAAAARELLAANLGYLHLPAGKAPFAIDADCRELGVANHDRELLLRCIAALTAGEHTARAQRLLLRYTDQRHDSALAWQRWYDEVQDRLYFSDRLGGRWSVAPKELKPAHRLPALAPGAKPAK